MTTHTAITHLVPLLAPLALAACTPREPKDEATPDALDARLIDGGPYSKEHGVRSSAPYTFHTADSQGCLDPELTGICNHFKDKSDVYFSGGPPKGGLEDGDYYFAVLAPGSLATAVQDGMDGNLSDDHAGRTSGDDGDGDLRANRAFVVRDHEIVRYFGNHPTAESERGRLLISLGEFDDSPNPNGLYVLAICAMDAAPGEDCTMDAFLVNPELKVNKTYIAGVTYYDANTDGHMGPGEPAISDFAITYAGPEQGREEPALDGRWSLALDPDEYTVRQELPNGRWMQTGNRVLQAVMFDRISVNLEQDMSYRLLGEGGAVADGVFFGNVCLGEGGGHRTEFWSDSLPPPLISAEALVMLRELNLRDADGHAFDPSTALEFRAWMRHPGLSNVQKSLSMELAAMALNVHKGFVVESDLVYAPGTSDANVNGFMTVRDLMSHANDALADASRLADPDIGPTEQLRLMNALTNANGDETFVQASPLRCEPQVGPSAGN